MRDVQRLQGLQVTQTWWQRDQLVPQKEQGGERGESADFNRQSREVVVTKEQAGQFGQIQDAARQMAQLVEGEIQVN